MTTIYPTISKTFPWPPIGTNHPWAGPNTLPALPLEPPRVFVAAARRRRRGSLVADPCGHVWPRRRVGAQLLSRRAERWPATAQLAAAR